MDSVSLLNLMKEAQLDSKPYYINQKEGTEICSMLVRVSLQSVWFTKTSKWSVPSIWAANV